MEKEQRKSEEGNQRENECGERENCIISDQTRSNGNSCLDINPTSTKLDTVSVAKKKYMEKQAGNKMDTNTT